MMYKKIAENVISQATKEGFEAEAYINVGSQTQVQVDRGEVEKLSYAGSKGIGIRVIQDGKMGYAYTSDFSPESITKTTADAMTLAEITDADAYRQLPEPEPIPEEDLELFDPEIGKLPMEAKIAFAKTAEKAALEADPRVFMTNRATYIDGTQQVVLANSKGFFGSYESSFVASFLMAMAMDGDDRTTAFGLGVSSFFSDLDAKKIGTEAGEKAAKLLGGKPVQTQTATVVYSPFAASGILGAVSRALTAEAMQRNRSFLNGKMGKDVASDMVTLLDNGRLPRGMATRPFDDEGVPTRATKLIDEGVLQAVLQDNYTALKEGGKSTGNAVRGSHRQSPGLSSSNFYIQPGPQSPEEVIEQVDQGLYVVNTMNTNSINPVSGDYSVSAQGFWIENGKLTDPVNGVTVAIPLDQLLMNIKAVANDLIFLPFMGSIGTPTIRVDNVMIGGL